MTATLILLLLIAAAMVLWSAAQDALAVARSYARDICQRAGVQLLDQTVALRSIRLRRNDEGRMRLQRTYQYAYSANGSERAHGEIAVLDGKVLWSSEPGG